MTYINTIITIGKEFCTSHDYDYDIDIDFYIYQYGIDELLYLIEGKHPIYSVKSRLTNEQMHYIRNH